MNNDEFFLAELGVIALSEIEAYNPDDFQRRYLQMLEEGIANYDFKLRLHLLDLANDCNRIPRQPDGTALSDVELPCTFEHIQLVLNIRRNREAHKGKLKTARDPLQKILRPCFELVMDNHDPNEDWYKRDLQRRWQMAGDACKWSGVVQVPDRLIAKTDSPIWANLGSAELFDDGLDFDTPPFYLNGGWLFGWNTVTKEELEALGKAGF